MSQPKAPLSTALSLTASKWRAFGLVSMHTRVRPMHIAFISEKSGCCDIAAAADLSSWVTVLDNSN